MNPRVSVIMPVFNAEAFVGQAIQSVLAQSLSSFELIAINDGCTDGSDAILEEYRRADPRVTVLRRGKLGFAAALQAGMREARGEYLARMDADDVCYQHRLERQVKLLDEQPSLTACGSAAELFGHGQASVLRFPLSPDAIRAALLFFSPLLHPTVVMRKAHLEQERLEYREFGGVADYDLWCQFDRRGLKMANLPEVLLRYRTHPGQITTSDRDKQIQLADLVRQEQLAFYNVQCAGRDLHLHSRLGRWDRFETATDLAEAGRWLSSLYRQMKRTRSRDFPLLDLWRQIASIWYHACATSQVPLQAIRVFLGQTFGWRRPLQTLRLAAHAVRGR